MSLRACGEKVNHPGGIFDGGIGPPCSIKIAETGSKTFTVQLPNLRRRRSILFSDELLTGPACLMRGSHLPGAFHKVFFSVFPMFFFLSVFVKPFFFCRLWQQNAQLQLNACSARRLATCHFAECNKWRNCAIFSHQNYAKKILVTGEWRMVRLRKRILQQEPWSVKQRSLETHQCEALCGEWNRLRLSCL